MSPTRQHQSESKHLKGTIHKSYTPVYLQMICLEVLRSQAFRFATVGARVDCKDHGEQKIRLRFLIREVRKILKRACLFPSIELRAIFLALLSKEARLRVRLAFQNHIVKDTLCHLERSFELDAHGSTFAYYQPWEEILRDRCTNNRLQATFPKSARQLLPVPAFKIITQIYELEAATKRFLSSVNHERINSPARTTALMRLKVRRPAASFDRKFHRMKARIDVTGIRPNPFEDVFPSIGTVSLTSLSGLGQVVENLEAYKPSPPSHTETTFHAISLRTFLLPTSFFDLDATKISQSEKKDRPQSINCDDESTLSF